MLKRIVAIALLSVSCFLPVNAQNAYDSTAATGSPSDATDSEDLGGWSSPTGPQNAGLNLPPTTTAGLALQGRKTLPDTRTTSLVEASGRSEKVFGDEGPYLPPLNNFTPDKYLENSFLNSPGMTTNHRMNGPSANGAPN